MSNHVYPWWLGYLLLNPLRYRSDPPQKLLAPYVSEGMKVLYVGCGPGYYSLPMARLVGQSGKVYCVDLQPRMIDILRNRAKRAGLLDRIVTSVCRQDSLSLDDLGLQFDFVLAYGVVHEVPDKPHLLAEIERVTKPGASLVIVEPKHEVKDKDFAQTLSIAQNAGFDLTARLETRRRHSVCLSKKAGHQAI